MSRQYLQTSNIQPYGGQARNLSSSNFGGVMQGRWQTNQPSAQQQPHIQQQPPPTQTQGQPRRLQQLSTQQQQQLQAMLMRQSQPQRQQFLHQPQPQQSQQRLVQSQTISYGQTSNTVPYSSQPLPPGYMCELQLIVPAYQGLTLSKILAKGLLVRKLQLHLHPIVRVWKEHWETGVRMQVHHHRVKLHQYLLCNRPCLRTLPKDSKAASKQGGAWIRMPLRRM
jgi:hypothetical protein